MQLNDFARELRNVYMTTQPERVRARHLAAITELARSLDGAPAESRRKPMSRKRPTVRAAKAAACAACLILATAGLAVAGVDLPAPADEAFEKVGVNLPNQAGEGADRRASAPVPERVTDVHAVIDSRGAGGCEFGHAVATAARGSALPGEAQAACDRGEDSQAGQRRASARARGRANADRGGSAGGGSVANGAPAAGRSFGEQTSGEAQGLRDATPEQRRQFGEDTADEARGLAGEPPAPQGAPVAEPPVTDAPAGPETGQRYSEGGQSIGDEASGGRKP